MARLQSFLVCPAVLAAVLACEAQAAQPAPFDLPASRIVSVASGVVGPEAPTILPGGDASLVEFVSGTVWRIGADGARTAVAHPGPGVAGTAVGRDGALYVVKLDTRGFGRGPPPGSTEAGHDEHEQGGPGPAAAGPPPLAPSPAAILRVDLQSGRTTTLYTQFEGRDLRGPDDLVIDRYGDLWITDIMDDAVYLARADGKGLSRIISGVHGVNGIALSPDGRSIYIVSNGKLLAYTLVGRGRLAGPGGKPSARVVATLPADIHAPDGIKTDVDGNILLACWGDGILAYSPAGKLLAHIRLPGQLVINIAFGGAGQRTLYAAVHPADDMSGGLVSLPWPAPLPAGAPRVLADGLRFPEGPLELGDGSVVAVEILADRLVRAMVDGTVTTYVAVGPGPNGVARGPDGALYVVTNGGPPGNTNGGSVQRVDASGGQAHLLYTAAGEHRLLGPNDIVFDEWGDFWFTDFASGALYHARTDGSEITTAVADLPGANGIALAPDGRTLYVVQAHDGQVVAFTIESRGRLAQADGVPRRRSIAILTGAGVQLDSMKVDAAGNLVLAAGEAGIRTLRPDGTLLDDMPLPGWRVTNMAFGGADLHTLYVTANHAGSTRGALLAISWPRAGLKLRY